eukprot:TRINITY_DN1145_c1_g1_i2.p1 TRINITY_DN1145_c1_g1~~TRINITY_DN1145_c1_g1_i2.p1  ORF type:complete len:1334 (-),score=342.97 TRINITY_DN1145_c1_g1_i2:21-4022(-)
MLPPRPTPLPLLLSLSLSFFLSILLPLPSHDPLIYQRAASAATTSTMSGGRPPRVSRSPVNVSNGGSASPTSDDHSSGRAMSGGSNNSRSAGGGGGGSSSSGGKEFGFIPNDMIDLLKDDSNWKVRAQAIEELQYIVFRLEDSQPLLPHLQPLMIFLTNMLDDPNFKISLTTLQIIGDLIGKVGMAVRPVTQTVLSALIEKLGDNKIVIRQANMKVISKLLQILTPKPILTELLQKLHHKNWHVREEIINTVIQALLVYRRYDFDYDSLVPQLVGALSDSKTKVRFVATEALAVVHSVIGDRINKYLSNLDDSQMSQLYERFASKTLPSMNADGLVEHQTSRELLSRQESRQGMRTARDIQVPTSAGAAPRISSAGRAASRGKIPWDIPPSRGSTRQSSASRRRQAQESSTADLYDNDVLLDNDYPETGAGDELVLLGGLDKPQPESPRHSSKRRTTAKTPRSRGPLTQQVRWDDQPVPAQKTTPTKTPRRDKVSLWLPEEEGNDDGYGDSRYVASPEEHAAQGRYAAGDNDRRMFRSMDESQHRRIRNDAPPPIQTDVHRSHDGGPLVPPATPQDIADKLSLLKRRTMTAGSLKTSSHPASQSMEGGLSSSDAALQRRARTAASNRDPAISSSAPNPIPHDERPIHASKTTRFEDHPDPFGQSGRGGGISHDEVPVGGGSGAGGAGGGGSADWLDNMEGAYPTPEEQSRIDSAKSRRSAPKLSQATMRRRAATSAKSVRSSHDTEDSQASSPTTPTSRARPNGSAGGGGGGTSFSQKASRAATVSGAPSRSLGERNAKPMEEVATEDLQPCVNPERTLRDALKAIDGNGEAWEKIFEAVTNIRRMAVHNPEVLLPQLHSVVLKVIVVLDNLRSQLSKNAVICFTDMFTYLGRSMDPELETVIPNLLSKTQSSGFISDEVDRALEAMIVNASTSRALATLLTHAQHRHKAIRVKSAQFIEMCVHTLGSRVMGRDFERLMPVLVKLLADSDQAARHAAKRTTVALAEVFGLTEFERECKRLTGDAGTKKFLAVVHTAQTKGMGQFSSGPTTGRRQTRGYTAASPKARSHTVAAPDHAGHGDMEYPESEAPKRRGVSSGRRKTTAAASSSSHAPAPADFASLPSIFTAMSQSDWRHRQDAVNQLCDLIVKHPQAAAGRVVNIFDHFTRCLSDANSKVNLTSLQAMLKIVPALGPALDQVLTNLTPVLASNLSSGNTTIRSVTSELFDELIANVDMQSLLQSMTNIVSYGNPRVKALLLEKLADSVSYVYSVKPSLLAKYVLPVSFKLLSENKGEIKTANAHLLQELYIMLDDSLFDHTHSLSASQLQRLKSIIEA